MVVKSFRNTIKFLDVHQDIHCGEETHVIPKILSHRVQMFQHFKSAVSEALVWLQQWKRQKNCMAYKLYRFSKR